MKLFYLSLLTFFIANSAMTQSGTISDPFLNIDQAANNISPGIYYFNINGYSFSSYVNETGYVLIGHDFGNGVGNLPITQNIDTVSRAILLPEILYELTDIVEVRISTSSGGTDVISTHDSIIWRVQNNVSLHRGAVDTVINDFWVGANSQGFTGVPLIICGPFTDNTLAQKIVHPCGDFGSFVWYPGYSYQREDFTIGEAPDSERFQMWVRGTPCSVLSGDDYITSREPYTWIDGLTYMTNNDIATFNMTSVQGCDSLVTLHLTIHSTDVTVSNTGFTLTAQNSGQNYQWLDCDNGFLFIVGETSQSFSPPLDGNYAVIINDGTCSDTSNCQTIVGLSTYEVTSNSISFFPNPAISKVTIKYSGENIEFAEIYSTCGKFIRSIDMTNNGDTIDINDLDSGSYIVRFLSTEGYIQIILLKL